MDDNKTTDLNNVISIDDERIQGHLDRLVRGSVEETLNALLEAEADALAGAGRYERSEGRRDYRAGTRQRKLHTKAGEVTLQVPKLRKQAFETAIIERYRRREASVEEALMEMYLAGVSVRRVEDITEALWGTRVSAGTVSNLNKKIYEKIETWRNQPILGTHPYVYLDGIVLKRSWAGEVRNVSLLVAIGVNQDGYREILGICEGAKEDKAGWSAFLKHLKQRGLKEVELIISDACLGLVESAGEHYPEARWQRCVVPSSGKRFTGSFSNPPQYRKRVHSVGVEAGRNKNDIGLQTHVAPAPFLQPRRRGFLQHRCSAAAVCSGYCPTRVRCAIRYPDTAATDGWKYRDNRPAPRMRPECRCHDERQSR